MKQQKIALVTGATRGIGLETVRQLAESGVHTILAGRNRGDAVDKALNLQSQGFSVEALQLDVTDGASIAAAVNDIGQRHGRLDILVNNAGILRDDLAAKPSEQPLSVWRETFETNVFGVIEVTRAFLPLLKASNEASIVNVSSLLGSITLHSDPASPIYDFKVPAYNASKSALNAWTVQLAHELRGTTIKVNAIHPGYVKTDMNSGEGELDIHEGARNSVSMALIGADGPSGSYQYNGQVLPW